MAVNPRKILMGFWAIISYLSFSVSTCCLLLHFVTIDIADDDHYFLTYIPTLFLMSLFLLWVIKVLICVVWNKIDKNYSRIRFLRTSVHINYWFPIGKSLFDFFSSIAIRSVCSSYKDEHYLFLPIASIAAYLAIISGLAYSWGRGLNQVFIIGSSVFGLIVTFLMSEGLVKVLWIPILCVLFLLVGVSLGYWKHREISQCTYTLDSVEVTDLTVCPDLTGCYVFNAYSNTWEVPFPPIRDSASLE